MRKWLNWVTSKDGVHNETDGIGLKVANAVKSDLIPIICIGETALSFTVQKPKTFFIPGFSALKLVDWKHQDWKFF